jgi:SpoIID/LytB domain protein
MMRPKLFRLFLVAALTGILAAVPAGALAADDEVVFTGSGWGHGIGMSQYGARALADSQGFTAEQITGYYYTGTTVAPTSYTAPVWIGLLQNRTWFDFQPIDGAVVDLCQNGDNEGPCPKSVHPASGETWRFASIGGGQCQFHRWNGAAFDPQGNPGSCRAAISWATQPSGKIKLTDLSNGTMARGELKIRPAGGDAFHVSLVIGLEEYLYGLGEMPSTWNIEALKAQALAGRSYAVAKAQSHPAEAGLRSGCACQLYSTTFDQAYVGWTKEALGGNWVAAVNATAGQVITHGGSVATAFYSSSSGGATENNEDIWGGAPLPYTRSVPDPWSVDPAAGNPNASWSVAKTRAAVAAAVGIHQLATVQVTGRFGSGSASVVTYRGLNANGGWVTVTKSGNWTRSKFGLRSGYLNVDAAFPVVGPAADSVALHDPRSGEWHLRDVNGQTHTLYYGNPADIPYVGDWDGNGTVTLGLYRQSTGFLYLRNTNTQGVADIEIFYGNPGDLPISGDWDGDGIDTVGIFRPSEAKFYLRNTNTQGFGDMSFHFGDGGDVPIAGDWNGDGIDTVGIFRSTEGRVYMTNTHSGTADFEFNYTGVRTGDRILAGDWDGDGIDTVGVFRPGDAAFYLRDTYEQATANIVITYGDSAMTPVAGVWGL